MICNRCGEDFVARTHLLRRCDPCRKIVDKENRVRAVNKRLKMIKDDIRYRLLTYAKSRSSINKTYCDLTVEDIVVPPVCPALDVEFEAGTYYTPSIDRIDNSKGYVKGNIQVISHQANAMKNNATPRELVRFAKWILENYESEFEQE